MKRIPTRKILIIYTLIIISCDQISKIIISNIFNIGDSLVFIPKLINLRLVKNTGAAFSILSSNTYLLTLISIFVSVILLYYLWFKTPSNKFQRIALPFLLGGTIGNGIDRCINGFVYDFIELVPINFPIFNFADIAINIAVIVYLIDIFIKMKDDI